MEASEAIAIRNKIIGVLVKRARQRSGKSQRECAEFLGCGPSTFAQYEQGRQGLSLPQLEALAHLFEIPLPSLWDEERALAEDRELEALPVAQLIELRQKMLAIQFRQCRHGAGLSQQQMAELLGCSTYMIAEYEAGRQGIPLAELEAAAEHCELSLADLSDEEVLPPSLAVQQRQILTRLSEMPPDVRDFVLKPTNALYLRIAMLLSSMKADSLRQIAETLLDITY